MVQKELEAQRELVDYGGGAFQPNAPPQFDRGDRKRGYGDSYRNDRDQRKRYRNDERSAQRGTDSDSKRDANESEKNPRYESFVARCTTAPSTNAVGKAAATWSAANHRSVNLKGYTPFSALDDTADGPPILAKKAPPPADSGDVFDDAKL
ncbi:hypothetical protein GUJ93_ZPchr0006g43025 [Zizania palustris]|uniref:Uncharacterized protein n=1 Tax=Zizania palustris TaxID=103762 RepID=A0A8J5W2U3_ZIZPA|nr:hypothetical protein GUJ93_ZPchr0006g43025 [Zizania palustris]